MEKDEQKKDLLKEDPSGGGTERQTGEEQPRLPVSFYQKLLNLPVCKISGGCDNCGRCSR